MDKIRVYIASHYTIGDPALNVRAQMETADRLISLGYAPFIPLLYHFQHISFPRTYEEWMALDLTWVTACNCLLRLPGESGGADREVAHAKANGIPVFYSVLELTGSTRISPQPTAIIPNKYGTPGDRTPEYYQERDKLLHFEPMPENVRAEAEKQKNEEMADILKRCDQLIEENRATIPPGERFCDKIKAGKEKDPPDPAPF